MNQLVEVWACPWVLQNNSGKQCGYIQNNPGICPFDHAEDVELVYVGSAGLPAPDRILSPQALRRRPTQQAAP